MNNNKKMTRENYFHVSALIHVQKVIISQKIVNNIVHVLQNKCT